MTLQQAGGGQNRLQEAGPAQTILGSLLPCSSEGLEQEVCLGSDRVTHSQLTTVLGYFQLQPLRDTMCPFWKPACILGAGVSSG